MIDNDHARLQKMLQDKIEENRKQLVYSIDAELVQMQYNLEHQQKQSERPLNILLEPNLLLHVMKVYILVLQQVPQVGSTMLQ